MEEHIDSLYTICKLYSPNPFNKEAIKNLLKHKKYGPMSTKYFSDIMKFHSMVCETQIQFNQEIIFMFFDFFYGLYFDRDDGFQTQPLDLSNSSSFSNLDFYSQMSNREYQVSIGVHFEEERTPNPILRADRDFLNKMISIGVILSKLDYPVYLVCGESHIINGIFQWVVTPYLFDSNVFELAEKYPTNTINVYVQVDFD